MTKHKTTAIRMDQKGDDFTITGITQSPRGTKTMAGRVKFKASITDRSARRNAIKAAVDELLGSTE